MDIIWVILSLAGVLGLFFILVYAMKKLGTGIGYVNGNRMKVIDRVTVGRDGMLLVVSVAGKLMLIGVTGQHIEKLSDIDMSPQEYNEQRSPEESGMSFSKALSQVIELKKNGKEKNGNDQNSL